MTPDEIRAEGFEPHVPGAKCPVALIGHEVIEVLWGDGKESPYAAEASYWWWSDENVPHHATIIGWRYANPADAQRVIAAKDAEIARLRDGLREFRQHVIRHSRVWDDAENGSHHHQIWAKVANLLENTNG